MSAEETAVEQDEFPCPMPETIVSYVLKMVSPDVQENVTEHLRYCPHCRIEVEALNQALGEVFGPRKKRAEPPSPSDN